MNKETDLNPSGGKSSNTNKSDRLNNIAFWSDASNIIPAYDGSRSSGITKNIEQRTNIVEGHSIPPRPAMSVPSTPRGSTPHKRNNLNKLDRIRSLNKVDLKSPLLTPGGHQFNLDNVPTISNSDNSSLHTSKSNYTLKSLAAGTFPESFFSLRNYYNDFTTTDWVRAFLQANKFNFELHSNRWISDDTSYPSNKLSDHLEIENTRIPFIYKSYLVLSKWFLIVLIGFSFSLIAFIIDKFEILLVGFKYGYCKSNWFASQVSCCVKPPSEKQNSNSHLNTYKASFNLFHSGYVLISDTSEDSCPDWVSWSDIFSRDWPSSNVRFDFLIYVGLTLSLAYFACITTLATKITGKATVSRPSEGGYKNLTSSNNNTTEEEEKFKETEPRIMYTAHGSGVPEVKTILSGFVIRRFLGTYTLIMKTISLIFAIASGMVLGKEGPYVHLATAMGNVTSRFFSHIHNNELLKKQILSASASAGVALAFGSPLGGVLFILEEINYYLPPHQLFQIFFCAISSTLFLKFLNPYGTGKTVLFELQYTSDWTSIELIFFVFLGIAGGIFGSCFVKFVQWWPKKFRSLRLFKNHPIREVLFIALLTGLITFWNPYTKQASSELVMDLATPCNSELDSSLCPSSDAEFSKETLSLIFAFVVKVVLTFITFGLKLPCGIYVPSMVVGALYGRIFATILQWINYRYSSNADGSDNILMSYICSSSSNDCVDLGIYSMIGAGAFMAGVTRMNITLVTILFELTSSYTYVLPISVAIAVANWSGSILEKNSLYESLLITNDYPFMTSETEPIDPFVSAGDIIHDVDRYRDRISVTSSNNKESFTVATALNFVTPMEKMNKLYIDVTNSPYVAMSLLQSKLILLTQHNLLDGCIPLIRNNVCVGLLYFSELEFCLDKLKEFIFQYGVVDEIFCKLADMDKYDRSNEDIKQTIRYNIAIARSLVDSNETDYFNYGAVDKKNDNEFSKVYKDLEVLTNFSSYVDRSPIILNHDSEVSLAHLIFDKIGTRVIVLVSEGSFYGVLYKKVLIDYCRREN